MDATRESEPTLMENNATVERKSERELVVTRTVNGPPRIVFEAWTKPDLLERWWAPKSFPISLLSCETDVRVGGGYRLVFGYEGSTMEFFGRYLEVTPPSRLVWTNDEGDGWDGHHGDLRGCGRQDAVGRARSLSLEGSSRRCDRIRVDDRDARGARAAGRASRHPGRERGTVMRSSFSRADHLSRAPLHPR